MLEISKKWIEIAKILGVNPNSKCTCPHCSHKFLEVIDMEIEDWDRIDRVIKCPNCGAFNTLTMKPK